MAPWIIGYGAFLVILFTVCTVTIGLSTTMWGFLATFAGCTVAALFLWWRDEYKWKRALSAQETPTMNLTPASSPVMAEATEPPPTSPSMSDWLSLEDDDFDLLETYTQDLTERVEAVYPLVERDHIHKIVWAVMIELFCKRMATASHSTPAAVIAAKMARAA
jgi:hypothetical protein